MPFAWTPDNKIDRLHRAEARQVTFHADATNECSSPRQRATTEMLPIEFAGGPTKQL